MTDQVLEGLLGQLHQVGKQDKEAQNGGLQPPVMFAEVADLASLEAYMTRWHDLIAASSLVMYDLCLGEVDHPPAVVGDAAAPVHLFRIHEEGLIEWPNALDRFGTNQHAGPDDPVHILSDVVREVGHVIPERPAVARKPLLQQRALHEGGHQSGEAPARWLWSAVGVVDSRPHHTHVRVPFHVLHHDGQGVAEDLGIRVQEQHVATLAMPKC